MSHSTPAMTEPCLSVVIPCFNEETTIEEVLDRVLRSPYTLEVIVVDDGSTDSSLKRAMAVADPRDECSLRRGTPAKARPCAVGSRSDVSDRYLQDATSSTTRRTSIRCCSRSSRTEPTWCSDPASARGTTSCAVFLALGWEHAADDRVQHVDESEPDGHGDVLQGVPRARFSRPSTSKRTDSASSPKSPPRWRGPMAHL